MLGEGAFDIGGPGGLAARLGNVKRSRYWREVPYPKQLLALSLVDVEDMLYGGAAGSAKTSYILMSASQYVDHPKWSALILRKNFTELSGSGSILDRARQWWEGMEGVTYNGVQHRFTWSSGAKVEFGHLARPGAENSYNGLEYTAIYIDQAENIPVKQLLHMQTRIRQVGSALPEQYRLIANPVAGEGAESKETLAWLKSTYVYGPKPFLAARLEDHLDIDIARYDRRLRAQGDVRYAQLRHGDWDVEDEGGAFPVDSIIWIDGADVPDCRWVRAWDCAATEGGGDWTVGVKMGRTRDGEYIISDMVRGQWPASEVERVIKRVAESDGVGVAVHMEQEPGSAGKFVVDHYIREVLSGYEVHAELPTGDKLVRARVLSAAMGNELVKVVRAGWNGAFVDELRAFPYGVHDDIVDASSYAAKGLNEEDRGAFMMDWGFRGRGAW